jgi:SepF-like predicted cell division protein (DUF552 family)
MDTINLTKTGFKLSFTEALDAESVKALSFKVQQWHYLYHEKYGSDKVDLKDLAIKSVKLSDDKKVVEIAMPLQAGKVVAIDFSGLKSQSKRSASSNKVFYTLNQTY